MFTFLWIDTHQEKTDGNEKNININIKDISEVIVSEVCRNHSVK